MHPWMFVRELETLETEGMERVLERLEAGGIRAIVLGDLWFKDGTPAFAPRLEQYRGLRRQPPLLPPGAEGRARLVERAIALARERGFAVYLHDWGQCGSEGMNDPESPAYAAARTRDTLEHFPAVTGFITDGPEWGYEIEPGNRQDLFSPFTRHDRGRAREWGFDEEALEAGRSWFWSMLQGLTPAHTELLLAGERGFFDGADALLAGPEFLQWLGFRERSVRNWVGALHNAVKEMDPDVRVACGPRTAAFAPLAGYNLRLLGQVTDFLCPKLYFWMHGFDGLKGTVHRWARTLVEWNEGLSEESALRFVYSLFGFTLPGVTVLADLERPLTRDFFRTVVPGEIAKAAARAGDATRLQPWMGLHHGGVRISTAELEWLLHAVAESRLPGIIYWHYEDMQPKEWALLQRHIR
jgi:hypothetical protein